MNIRDRFVMHQGEPCFDTKDGQYTLLYLSSTTQYSSWSPLKGPTTPYTPTVLEVIHILDVIKSCVLDDQAYEKQLITELEEYLYGINQGSP